MVNEFHSSSKGDLKNVHICNEITLSSTTDSFLCYTKSIVSSFVRQGQWFCLSKRSSRVWEDDTTLSEGKTMADTRQARASGVHIQFRSCSVVPSDQSASSVQQIISISHLPHV